MDKIKTLDLFVKPQRDAQGHFIKGNTISVGNEGGPPCTFCQDADTWLKKVKLYSQWTLGRVDRKRHIPFLEELCDEEYLNIHTDTLRDWTTNYDSAKHDKKAEHAELAQTIKVLIMRQKKLLLNRTLSDKTPVGAIFQLKANHGMMESEKRIIAGDQDNPQKHKLEIEITEAKKNG